MSEHDPETLAGLLKGLSRSACGSKLDHVHIHVEGFSDHLILCWGDRAPTRVLAKSPERKRSRGVRSLIG